MTFPVLEAVGIVPLLDFPLAFLSTVFLLFVALIGPVLFCVAAVQLLRGCK